MPAAKPSHLVYGSLHCFRGTVAAYKEHLDDLKRTFRRSEWQAFALDAPKGKDLGPDDALVVHYVWGRLLATTKGTAKAPAQPAVHVGTLRTLRSHGDRIGVSVANEVITGRTLFLLGGPASLRLVLSPAADGKPELIGPELARVQAAPGISRVDLGHEPLVSLESDALEANVRARATAVAASGTLAGYEPVLRIEAASGEAPEHTRSLEELAAEWGSAVPAVYEWPAEAMAFPLRVRRLAYAHSAGQSAAFLVELTNLQELKIRGKLELPEGIGALGKLQRLTLECELTRLPASVAALESLEEVCLDRNDFAEVPASLLRLPRLRTLSLSKNKLTAIPAELFGPTSGLHTLDVRDNQIASIPREIGQSGLRILRMDSNVLESLPPQISDMRALEELDVGGNKLQRLPDEIGNLGTLKRLSVRGNQLEQLPATVGKLTELRVLAAEHNRIVRLPDSLGGLVDLVELYLGGNRLSELLASSSAMASLAHLHVEDNQLVALPEDIGRCQSLARLYASKNRLTTVPESLRQLQKLEILDLRDNQLTRLPSMRHLNLHLTAIRLAGNPIVVESLDPPELRDRVGLRA